MIYSKQEDGEWYIYGERDNCPINGQTGKDMFAILTAEKTREVSAMQLDLRHTAEQNAKRYRENLSYLRGYDAAAAAGRPLSPKYVEKAGWVWAVERVRADLAGKEPEKERFFARLYHLDGPCRGTPGRGSEIMKLSLELNVSPSTLYKWREGILADLLMAAVQAGVLKPF